MGRRFAWNLLDDDIDDWMVQFPHEMRAGMRAIAVALRDYGAIGCDHGGKNGVAGALWIEHDLTARWREIGFDPDKAVRGLHQLLRDHWDTCWAVTPPVFPKGDETRVAVYSGVNYPSGYTD
jgi:hypothetical protein